MTSVPPPPDPLDSTGSSATTFRRDAALLADFARDFAALAFLFFATDDARAEAPRPAMRLTVGLVASSVVFFLAAISCLILPLPADCLCWLLVAACFS